jgi:16S rRNA (cytosine967-C5)-methyltransferase
MALRDIQTARTIAIEALSRFDPKRNYAGPILDKLLPKTDERQRATDLVFGTIRNRLAIDTVIGKLSRCPVERIPAKLLNILRVAAYEIIYSPATAEYSIVDEAAENTKVVAGKKQVGFVNAVLRQIARLITNRQSPLNGANVTRTLPQSPTTGCELAIAFLPDPQAQPADYLSAAFSLPKWLVANWLAEFGFSKVWQICLASNRRPSIYLRPNTLKTTTQELAEKLRQADTDVEIAPDVTPAQAGVQKAVTVENHSRMDSRFRGNDTEAISLLRIKSPRDITQLPGFAQGEFTVQDISAFEPVRILNPQANWTILDLCAAPGVKTTQLAEATADSAKIIATDIDSQRLKKVKENITRLGLKSITVVPYDELFTSEFGIRNSTFDICLFDAVFLDVPCSNTGVLARRIEARYRLKPNIIKQLVTTQQDLLCTAAQLVKPQGKICYSTCSIQKEENSRLIKNFLQQNPSFALESEKLILPSAGEFDNDGGYIAIIVKQF